MPKMYDPNPDAFYCTPSELDLCNGAEQEHADSCDVNKMIKRAANGQTIRTSLSQPIYGYDDTTMDAVQYRIQKEQLEKDLNETAKSGELDEAFEKHIPEGIKKKFGLKFKKKQNLLNDDSNDDKSTAPKKELSKDLPISPSSKTMDSSERSQGQPAQAAQPNPGRS